MVHGYSSCTGMSYTSAYVGCLVSHILIDIQEFYLLFCSVKFMFGTIHVWHNVHISELGPAVFETHPLTCFS